MTAPADLRLGERSEAVRDLQRRLAAGGFDVHGDDPGTFGSVTRDAVLAFQARRHLREDGVCGPQTWAALVEAGFGLGDRLLYLRRPMLRGDDVRALQKHLNALGFDAGREDGIFGDATARALLDLQRNTAVPADGICGPVTLDVMRRVGGLAGGSVAAVREREALRDPRDLAGTRAFVAVPPGLDALGDAIERELVDRGARVLLDPSGVDDRTLAEEANRFDAQRCLAVRTGHEPGLHVSYFGTGEFHSATGRRFAGLLLEELTSIGAGRAAERSYPLLRETRMPAVLCEMDPAATAAATGRVGELGRAFAEGVRRSVEEPLRD